MAFRFFRRIKVAKGIYINLSKKGAGVSFGVPGTRMGFGPRGTYYSLGIPGSGMSYRKYLTTNKKHRDRKEYLSSLSQDISDFDLEQSYDEPVTNGGRILCAIRDAFGIKDFDSAIIHLNNVLAIQSDSADVYFLLALICWNKGDYTLALNHCNKALLFANSFGREVADLKDNIHIPYPLSDFCQDIGIDITRTGAILVKILGYDKVGDFNRATKEVETLIESNPQNDYLKLILICFFYEHNMFQDTIDAFHRLSMANTFINDRCLLMVAYSLMELGNYREAEKILCSVSKGSISSDRFVKFKYRRFKKRLFFLKSNNLSRFACRFRDMFYDSNSKLISLEALKIVENVPDVNIPQSINDNNNDEKESANIDSTKNEPYRIEKQNNNIPEEKKFPDVVYHIKNNWKKLVETDRVWVIEELNKIGLHAKNIGDLFGMSSKEVRKLKSTRPNTRLPEEEQQRIVKYLLK